MSLISPLLKRKFLSRKKNQKVLSLDEARQTRERTDELLQNLIPPERLKEYDPLHAAYLQIQDIVVTVVESLSEQKELKKFYKMMEKLESIFVPSYPPMSPLSKSFFMTWLFYDMEIGKSKETMGGILSEISTAIGFPEEWKPLLDNFNDSFVGIYEHGGFEGDRIILKNILTQESHRCHIASGYSGRPGELWFVRLLASFHPAAKYSVAFTTPYILILHSKAEWIEFFERNQITAQDPEVKEKLKRFMKTGNAPEYWLNFILDGYYDYRNDAVILAGIPDRAETLPHSESNQP